LVFLREQRTVHELSKLRQCRGETTAMNTNLKLTLAVIMGVSIGIVGAKLLRAQQAKTPPGYVIAEVEVTDPVALKKYSEKAPQTEAQYGGHYVIRGGGKIQSLEGDAPKGFIVVIAFDSVEKARQWYDSPEYKEIRPIRQNATKSRLYIAEGYVPQ
jgi:uncharacterized protein (DUF1330 family)